MRYKYKKLYILDETNDDRKLIGKHWNLGPLVDMGFHYLEDNNILQERRRFFLYSDKLIIDYGDWNRFLVIENILPEEAERYLIKNKISFERI